VEIVWGRVSDPAAERSSAVLQAVSRKLAAFLFEQGNFLIDPGFNL